MENPIADYLLNSGRVFDLFVLSRYMYRMGADIMDNAQYEKIQSFCKRMEKAQNYLNRTYDDDPVPHDLLNEFGIKFEEPIRHPEREKYYDLLNSEKSTSIDSVTDYPSAWAKMNNLRGRDIMAMLKVDGIYTKAGYPEGTLAAGLSRGRAADSLDITEGLSRVLPNSLGDGFSGKYIRINSECFAMSEMLEYLRTKYDSDRYKTEKSSAISMLRVPKDRQDYAYLRALTFSAEGLGESISESLDRADSLGFSTVPRFKIKSGEIPDTFDDFIPWFRGVLDRMYVLSEGIPSDGVVFEVDSYSYVPEIKNQYSPRNFAAKMEQWSFDYYVGIVDKILQPQKRVNKSCRIAIIPVIARDRTEAKMINGFNPAILNEHNIFPGSRMYFERNSGAVNILIYGGKLKELDLDSRDSD